MSSTMHKTRESIVTTLKNNGNAASAVGDQRRDSSTDLKKDQNKPTKENVSSTLLLFLLKSFVLLRALCYAYLQIKLCSRLVKFYRRTLKGCTVHNDPLDLC